MVNQKKFFKRVENIWTPAQIAEYKAILGEHGAMTATLNWYRAIDPNITSEPAFSKDNIRSTLFIWGTQDGVVAPSTVSKQAPYIKAPFKILELDTGHSLMQLETDSVTQAIFSHIKENGVVE